VYTTPRPPTRPWVGASRKRHVLTSGPPALKASRHPRDVRLAHEVVLAPRYHCRRHPRRARRGGGGARPRSRISPDAPLHTDPAPCVRVPRGHAAFPAAGTTGEFSETTPASSASVLESSADDDRSPGSDGRIRIRLDDPQNEPNEYLAVHPTCIRTREFSSKKKSRET
jgi:hypothetical protein